MNHILQPQTQNTLTPNHIIRAQNRINPHIHQTPLVRSPWLSDHCNGEVWLKLENEQVTGSFKARGSLNKLMWLREQRSDFYPVTVSSGNHGLGVARALDILDINGAIFLPENVEPAKLSAIEQFNVKTQVTGETYDQTERYALEQVEQNGWSYVSPYNDGQVISGQGTIAREITEKLPSPDHILTTVGGGGLISGMGTYLQKVAPGTHIIGCQPKNSPVMSASVQAGCYQHVETQPTLSDGSAVHFDRNSITLNLCKKLVDDFMLVNERAIKEAIWGMVEHHQKVIEGAAGVAVASLMKNPASFKNQTTVIVICGANISTDHFSEVIRFNRS